MGGRPKKLLLPGHDREPSGRSCSPPGQPSVEESADCIPASELQGGSPELWSVNCGSSASPPHSPALRAGVARQRRGTKEIEAAPVLLRTITSQREGTSPGSLLRRAVSGSASASASASASGSPVEIRPPISPTTLRALLQPSPPALRALPPGLVLADRSSAGEAAAAGVGGRSQGHHSTSSQAEGLLRRQPTPSPVGIRPAPPGASPSRSADASASPLASPSASPLDLRPPSMRSERRRPPRSPSPTTATARRLERPHEPHAIDVAPTASGLANLALAAALPRATGPVAAAPAEATQ